jgi:hypothetical protein
MKSLIALKLLDTREERDFAGLSYREFTASSIGKPGGGREEVAAFLGLSIKSDTMERLGWLGLFDERPLPMAKGTNVDVIVDLMVKKMSYLPGEIDMIIVHDEIEVEFPDRRERHLSTMRVEGVPQGDSAMSRAVSLPAAIASRLILEGNIDLSGVHMPMLSEIYEPVLTELEEYAFALLRASQCDRSLEYEAWRCGPV